VPFVTPVEGGGATTLEASVVPIALRVPRWMPLRLTAGGGATTLGAREALVAAAGPSAGTAGGGGTTSVAPKSFPIRLLMNDPLPDCVGGGGTTVFDESGILPLERRRMSCESGEGGGAMTAGAGRFSLGLLVAARSGAETGGGITAGLVICIGEREISRLTPPGAGGITFAASAGVERERSRLMLGAGATSDGLSDGAVSE
jgi:hypothetical protein